MSVQRRDKQAISAHFSISKKIKNVAVDENDPFNGLTDGVVDAIECLGKKKDSKYQIKLASEYRNGDIRTIMNIEEKLIQESGSSKERIANEVGIIKNYLQKLPVFFSCESIGIPQFIGIEKEKAEYTLINIDRTKIPVTLKKIHEIAMDIQSMTQTYYDETIPVIVDFVNQQFKNPKYKFGYFVLENEIKKYLQPLHISIVNGELQCTFIKEGSNEIIVYTLKNDDLQGFIKKVSDQYGVSTD